MLMLIMTHAVGMIIRDAPAVVLRFSDGRRDPDLFDTITTSFQTWEQLSSSFACYRHALYQLYKALIPAST